MRWNKAESLGDVLHRALREQGLESPLNEHRLITAWGDLLGPSVSAYTSSLYIRNQTLHVHLTSAVLRNELMMRRAALVRMLNERVGAQVIADIMLH